MLTLLKPYGRIYRESELLKGIVHVEGVDGSDDPGALARKLASADILLGNIDMRLTEPIFESAPKLRSVICRSIGTDYVDLQAASRRNILVLNSPTFCVKAVAEYAICMMFLLARQMLAASQALKNHDWEVREQLRGIELEGRILGLIGFGRIGREVARRAIGLGMRVLAYDAYAEAGSIFAEGAEPAALDRVITSADVLSIHVPLTSATRDMIGGDQIARMKDGAILINVSRGGIVDENAVLEALRTGKLRGAGLDALTQEPPQPGHALYDADLPNLLMTPHAAWNTEEARARNAEVFIAQVRAIASCRLPQGVVNESVREDWMRKYCADS